MIFFLRLFNQLVFLAVNLVTLRRVWRKRNDPWHPGMK